jgi:hypothetical protein
LVRAPEEVAVVSVVPQTKASEDVVVVALQMLASDLVRPCLRKQRWSK